MEGNSYQNFVSVKRFGKVFTISVNDNSVEGNLYGFTCRTTSLRSTMHDTILNFVIFFVKYLPESKKIKKKSLTLFLDGH